MADRLRVLCCRGDRFGARLKNLLGAIYFAEELDADLHVQWDLTDPESGAAFEFEGFFDPAIFEKFEVIKSVVPLPWTNALKQFGLGQNDSTTTIGPQTKRFFLDGSRRTIRYDQSSQPRCHSRPLAFREVPPVEVS